MEQNPFDLITIPHEFGEMIKGAKEYKKKIYSKLINYSADQIENYLNHSIELIQKNKILNDPIFITKSGYVIYSLHKISENKISIFDNLISKFNADKSQQTQIFLTFVVAKLCHIGDSTFARSKLTYYHQIAASMSDPRVPAYFLLFLSKFCPKAILLNFAMFLDSIKISILKKADLLATCKEALENFVDYLANKIDTVKETPILNLYDTAIQCIDQNNIETAFGILSVLLGHEFTYPFLKMHAEQIFQLTSHLAMFKTVKCHELILWCEIYSAPLDKPLFEKMNARTFFPQIISKASMKTISPTIAKAYVRAVQLFPDIMLKNRNQFFIPLTAMLFTKGLEEGYLLIEELIKNPKYTPILNQGVSHLSNILAIPPVNDNYINHLPFIFSKLPALWEYHKTSFTNTMINLLKKDNVNALKVLSKCPPISSNDELLNILGRLVYSQKEEVRQFSPAAFLHNAQYLESTMLSQTIDKLLNQCLCEQSSKVRLAIVQAFKPSMYRYLSSFQSLRYLEILSNDNDSDVKFATIKLLMNLCDITPLTVEPILRHVILDTMYILKTPGSHTLRVESSKLLDLIVFSKSLLPVYIDGILKTILTHFEKPPSSSLTYFELNSYYEISEHFAKMIGEVAKQDFSLIQPHVSQIIYTSIRVLKDFSRRNLKIIIVESLSTIIANGMPSSIERADLAGQLISIASKWNSRKLNTALLRLLGLLGAITDNPKRDKDMILSNQVEDIELDTDRQSYYLKVVCLSLLNVLTDQSLASDHNEIAKILVLIFCTKDSSLFESFKRFLPILMDMIRTKKNSTLLSHLQRLCLQSPPAWLTLFSDEIIALIYELWNSDALNDILSIIPALASVLMDRFSPFLPQCVSLLLDCLHSNRTTNADISLKVINSLLALRKLTGDYLFLIIPDLTAAVTYSMSLTKVKIYALTGLRVIVQSVPIKQYSSEIIRCITISLKSKDPQMIEQTLQVLYSLQLALGKTFEPFISQISSILADLKIPQVYFNELNENAKRPNPKTLLDYKFIIKDDPSKTPSIPEVVNPNVNFNIELLFENCRYNEEEYPWKRKEWFRRFVSSVITNSPVLCISLTAPIAQHIQQVTDALFNIGFLSCWEKMKQNEQKEMGEIISNAILSTSLSDNNKSTLISLIEFMDRAEVPIDISNSELCRICRETGHHAKAYYFATKWLSKQNSLEAKDALVYLASSLDLKENVVGLVSQLGHGDIQPRWYEYLGDWKNALAGYNASNDEEGIVRCLCNMMDYKKIADQCNEILARNGNLKPLITALFFEKDYNKVLKLSEFYTNEGPLPRIYAATSALLIGNKNLAIEMVNKGLDLLGTQARLKFKHDTSSLSKTIVYAMAMDEIYEQATNTVDKVQWQERIRLSTLSYQEYETIFEVRRNMLTPTEIRDYHAGLLACARIAHEWDAFDSFIQKMPEEIRHAPEIEYAIARGEWEKDHKAEAIQMLKNIDATDASLHTQTHILYYIGHYTIRIAPADEVYKIIDDAVYYLKKSLELKKDYYHAIHRLAWGLSASSKNNPTQIEAITEAVECFIECVKLKPNKSLGDLLQMVHIVFNRKLSEDVFMKVKACFSSLAPNYLLFIIPQLFAQITNENSLCFGLAVEIITTLLPQNYHSLLYPLFQMISKDSTTSPSGKSIAKSIIQKFASINHVAVHQAHTVSKGLYDASYSCLEKWLMILPKIQKELENFNLQGAAEKFMPAYNELLQQETPDATRFAAIFRQDRLDMCYSIFNNTTIFGADRRIPRLRDRFRDIVKLVQSHVETIRAYKLPDLSPSLGAMKNFVLAVPGTFKSNKELITIDYFDPYLEVIVSKQHPRIVIIHGHDGKPHRSLLKGHEDLRLDQRVMQFFQLMNIHIKYGPNTRMRDYSMHTYTITPISVRSGLIQFIDDTDTLYSLISNYRKQHQMKIQNESALMVDETCQDVDKLTRMQRMEALETVSSITEQTDLANAIWIKSPSSVEWIHRTMRFAKTTGVMSIIGYILGLGDRHPSNIMIHKSSGDVIHIDFSDCFEISRTREMFPEAVPFRLTRMMVYAFGASGVEGNFRISCEETMKIVRSHRESIMTVLDIFLKVPIESEEGYDNLDINKSIERITEKISGQDFNKKESTVEEHVSALIDEATDLYNLASLYHGWTPLW